MLLFGQAILSTVLSLSPVHVRLAAGVRLFRPAESAGVSHAETVERRFHHQTNM